MLTFDCWKFPDGETHMTDWMTATGLRVDGRLTYQYQKYEAARALCRSRRVAVDAGAHVGLWSFWMARDFERVDAFEPDPAHHECWIENMAGVENAALHRVALGELPRMVSLRNDSPGSSGNTRIALKVPGSTVPMVTLDSFQLTEVDLLKVDCEGFEYFAMLGAVETLQRCRPVVIVEQKATCGRRYGRGDEDARDLLASLGARQVHNLGQDFVMRFEGDR